MSEECAPPIPFNRLLGRSGFCNEVSCIKADTSNDIQYITFIGGCLMWNDSAVCGGRVQLKMFVRVWYYMWKSLERESAMIFSIPLMSCEYRYV